MRTPRLGQHFLTSKSALSLLIDTADITQDDTVLEIGPGKGVLTKELLAKAGKVIAVEKDRSLGSELSLRFKKETGSGKLTLILDDIRNVSLKTYGLSPNSYKLVANIPYYITGELLRQSLGGDIQPELMVFMVQKEVAERIARAKKESILSISVKAYGTPHYIGTVKRGSFSPAPAVDSAILLIADISKERFTEISECFFFSLVKSGFAEKRKQLKNNLGEFATPEEIKLIFTNLHIDIFARAEDIPLNQWFLLARILYKQKK